MRVLTSFGSDASAVRPRADQRYGRIVPTGRISRVAPPAGKAGTEGVP